MKTLFNIRCWCSAIKYALMQEDLTILEKSSVPTPMDTLENFIETIGKIYDQFQDQINGMALSMLVSLILKEAINILVVLYVILIN